MRAEAGISVRKLKPAASIAQGSGIFPLPPPLEIYQPAGLSQGFLTRMLARLPPRCESVVCASNVSTTFATFATTAEEPAEEPPKNRKERGVIHGLKFVTVGIRTPILVALISFVYGCLPTWCLGDVGNVRNNHEEGVLFTA